MKDVVEKYDAVAERYSATDYADPERYYARRARAVVELGVLLTAGDTVLDFACGDGALGPHLLALGVDYRGVDASPRMVEVAARVVPGRVTLGDFELRARRAGRLRRRSSARSTSCPTDARSSRTSEALRRRSSSSTSTRARTPPRRFSPTSLPQAGVTRSSRPFLLPQRRRVPAPIASLLAALEPLPGARALTRLRFPLLVSARA